jgi:hypothetical protein
MQLKLLYPRRSHFAPKSPAFGREIRIPNSEIVRRGMEKNRFVTKK